MRRIQWNRCASFCTSPTGGKGLAPRKLADLSGEVTDAVARYCRLATETVTAHDIDGALQHEPSRSMAFAGIEHDLARFEDRQRAALRPRLHGMHLPLPHDNSPKDTLALAPFPGAGRPNAAASVDYFSPPRTYKLWTRPSFSLDGIRLTLYELRRQGNK